MHRHGNLQATADTYAAGVLRVTEDDRFLSIAKLFFAYGLGNSLTFPFAVGGTAILEPGRPTPAGMIELVEAERPTLFFASPGFVAVAARHRCSSRRLRQRAGDGDRRRVPAGRAAAAVQRALRPSRPRRHRLDRGTAHLPLQHPRRAATGHERVAGSRLRGDVARRRGQPRSPRADTPGYLHVRGPSVATGYWQRPDATAAAFLPDGWLRTGDVYTRGRRRVVDVPRPQQRHDQGWRHLGVAGRGGGGADRASRRARGRRRRRPRRRRAGDGRRLRRRPRRPRHRRRRARGSLPSRGWQRSSGRAGSSSSTSSRGRPPARSAASPCASSWRRRPEPRARRHRPRRPRRARRASRRSGGGAPAAGVPPRRARVARPLALVPRRRPRGDRRRRRSVVYSRHGYGRSDPWSSRDRSRTCTTRRTTCCRRCCERLGIERPVLVGPQRRRLDRPAPRRWPAIPSPASCCSPRTSSSRTARSRASPPHAMPTRRPICVNAWPAITSTSTPRSVAGTTCGCRRRSGRGTSPTARVRSTSRSSLVQGTDDQYGSLAQLDAIERGVDRPGHPPRPARRRPRPPPRSPRPQPSRRSPAFVNAF